MKGLGGRSSDGATGVAGAGAGAFVVDELGGDVDDGLGGRDGGGDGEEGVHCGDEVEVVVDEVFRGVW